MGSESIVVYMGPEQMNSGRTQTELFDGYSFRMGNVSLAPYATLEELVTTERKNAQEHCQEGGVVSDITPTKVAGQDAFRYVATGCYIDYTETFVGFKDRYYRISQSYVGTMQESYKGITDQILSSVQFTE